ncbi:MAG: hypothetical protein HFJ25_03145 [Clostridia bacterium]|nr:hypothetical protein [Clostridia bacterium]
MKKQKKIIYFSILILAILIITTTFNIQNIKEIFFKSNISNLTESTIPIEEWNITPTTTVIDNMIDKDFLIGKYQFNYTGASSAYSELNNYNTISGYSHLDIMSPYEEGPYASSSGAYLDSSHNNKGSIYKAYLIIESNHVDNYQDYPITIIYSGNNEIPINGIKTKMNQWYINPNTSKNYIGYIDISNYVKKNGYGWYYCCNIPYKNLNEYTDTSADWKIVTIEENPYLPIRTLKLQLGFQCGNFKNTWYSTTIDLGNITTKKTGNVTGQFLYNITNCDGTNSGKLQIYTGSIYKNIISTNGYRTELSPLPGIKTRNTLPIKQNINYSNPLYYSGNNNAPSKTKTTNSIPITGADVELLDIDGTTNYHNITLENNKNSVILRFNPNPYLLNIHMFGIAYDIDAPEYTSKQTSTVHNDSYVTVNGSIENASTTSSQIGMHNGKITVNIDKDLTILSTTAYFIDSKGNKTELNESMYKINRKNNTITYIYGKDIEGKSLLGDTLTYIIETNSENLLSKNKAKYTITNEVTSNGKLIYGGNNEDYEMDNVIWTTSSATLYKPLTLTIKPNGGTYKNNNLDSTYKTYTEQTHEIHTPTKNGYTFKGWSIEGTNSSLNQNTLSIGTTDTILTANWELDPLILKSTVNLNLSDNKGSIELNWSDYNIQNKYFVIYRKSPISSTYETIVPLKNKFKQNTYIDITANDKTSPTEPQIDISTDNQSIKINPTSQDLGNTYSYYIESYDSTTNILLNKSNEISK